MIRITFERTNELLDEIVAEFGEDYVYKQGDHGCIYSYNGQPSCLVGQVLHRYGVDLSETDYSDNGEFGPERGKWVGMFAPALLRSLEERGDIAPVGMMTEELLSKVQTRQDGGDSWGDAVRWAREELNSL